MIQNQYTHELAPEVLRNMIFLTLDEAKQSAVDVTVEPGKNKLLYVRFDKHGYPPFHFQAKLEQPVSLFLKEVREKIAKYIHWYSL